MHVAMSRSVMQRVFPLDHINASLINKMLASQAQILHLSKRSAAASAIVENFVDDVAVDPFWFVLRQTTGKSCSFCDPQRSLEFTLLAEHDVLEPFPQDPIHLIRFLPQHPVRPVDFAPGELG